MPATDTTDAKALAAWLRDRIGVTGPRSKVLTGAFGYLNLLAGYGDVEGWPYAATTALHGIAWARQTGRLDGTVELAIRGLSDWQVCTLVAEVAVACPAMGDVPRFLIDRFAR